LLNQTFLDKTIDDVKKGKLTLYKVNIGDAETINHVQDFINEIADTIGQNGELDPTRKTYSSTNFIANGDNRKVAIGKLDASLKLNQDEINNLNNAFGAYLNAGSFKIRSYISDNAYETANGSPNGGEIYYNTTTGFIRYYNGIETSWDDVGKQVLPIQEVPIGVVNGVNKNFDVANMPINTEALNVFVNGLIIPKSKWSFSSPTITFVDAPANGSDIYVSYLSDGNPSTPVISAGTNNVIYHQITAGDVTAKAFTLPSSPSTPTHVFADVVGGSTLEYGTDFEVSGNQFEWDGLTLDGLISINDVLRVQYFN
jgi:hypothetical protein